MGLLMISGDHMSQGLPTSRAVPRCGCRWLLTWGPLPMSPHSSTVTLGHLPGS